MRSESIAERIPSEEREAFIQSLSPDEALLLQYEWAGFWSRPKQLPPPGDWDTWLVLAGRGFGKTRTGSEWVRSEVEAGRAKRIALVAPTAADVRDVMIEGESGILAISPPWNRPEYEPSKRRLTWPNGAVATCFSADEPNRLRGPQHDLAWADELAAWRFPDAWDQLQFGLRLGSRPRVCVTTTPRPTPLIKRLVADPRTTITRGSTYENSSNLAESFRQAVLARYEGTRLGRQELHAEILEDTPGALWTRALLDSHRIRTAPDLTRIVVGVDPSVAGDGGGDECGIVVVGVAQCACKGSPEQHAFVLDDVSEHLSPADWARRVVDASRSHRADRIIAESNQGGALVESNLRTVDRHAPIKLVHASRGKRARAEPVAALYEQGKVHHVGSLAKLEDEMCSWAAQSGDQSPNRIDALVWAITEVALNAPAPAAYTPIRIPSRWS